MNMYKGLAAVALVFCSITHTIDVEDLKDAYKKEFKKLRRLLLSVDGNRQSAEHIVRLQKSIRVLEDQHGITDTASRVGRLRIEACIIQNQDPEAKKVLTAMAHIVKDIKRSTTAERKEIDRITQLQSTNQTSETKKQLEAELKRLDKKIKEKTKDQSLEIDALNKKLYTIPSIQEKLEAVGPLATELQNKYKAIREYTKPLDGEIAKHTKDINKRMGPYGQQIKKLRVDIKKLRHLIEKEDPCFAARESMLHQRWERLVA